MDVKIARMQTEFDAILMSLSTDGQSYVFLYKNYFQ